MIRRHFFLVGALVILVLMVVLGGLKLASGKASGAREASAPASGGRSGAPRSGPAGGPGRGVGVIPVSVVTVQPKPFTDALEVLGVAKGRQSVTLTAPTTQLVRRVRFVDGQFVGRGAVLVELQSTAEDAALAQSEAKLVQAQRAYDRYRSLGQQGFVSKAAIDQYQADYLAAKADVDAALARRSDHLIRAPFAGVVGLSDVAPGALVNPGAPIVTLDDLSSMRVDFQVPERYLSQIREGQMIVAHADAYPGEAISGRIARIDTRVDERTRAVTARAEFANPDRRLKPGMMIRVRIASGERTTPAVPESAVAVQGDSAFVYVLQGGGANTTTEQRPVATGLRQDGFVEILDGVIPGERLVADGLNKLQPGQAVRAAGAGRRAESSPGVQRRRP